MLASRPENEISKRQALRRVSAIVAVVAALYVAGRLLPSLDLVGTIVIVSSILLTIQALFSSYLMLYAWEHPERLAATRGPSTFRSPKHRFSVLLPARHEEAVIYETIRKLCTVDYPVELIEILIVCYADDAGTMAEARRAIEEIGATNVGVLSFSHGPINKPSGLNAGLRRTSFEVVTVFDAEDDIDPDIFNVVNTVMLNERVNVVQAGVQLMNFRDHWFSIHNVLEYFFWFKSRLHFHAHVGMIPLGGNTVFMRRHILDRIGGWDENCLTEDAEIGLQFSLLGERIRVVYDPQHVTREETPDSVGAFVRQRTRWNQGFIQVLKQGAWSRMPTTGQRALALYTLGYPLIHAVIALTWPLAVASALLTKMPVTVTLFTFLPLYALVFQLLASIVGAYAFAREYGFKMPLLMPLQIIATFLPFQWILGVSAVRAAYREILHRHDWEKTGHLGAHRQPARPSTTLQPAFATMLSSASTATQPQVERASTTAQVLR
jgi:cellulose synthase/poly-beta-1,6-N-acetylglucosamine synthase-like glycosyltransferase